ncbi:MAG: YggL family protein [Planctomycetota bacterium]|nr:DUF469 family protein [Planctomycetaceae bacterium]MDQ3330398.1 YggL family protein [Planctomycetota bacterium]
MKKRLRKKLRRAEFQELGCEVQFRLDPVLGDTQINAFVDVFLQEAIEAQRLGLGGGGRHEWEGFVAVSGRGSVTEANRAAIEQWLGGRSEVLSHEVGPLRDAWYDD